MVTRCGLDLFIMRSAHCIVVGVSRVVTFLISHLADTERWCAPCLQSWRCFALFFDGAAVGCAAAARLAVILADLFLNIFSGNCVASVQVAYEL